MLLNVKVLRQKPIVKLCEQCWSSGDCSEHVEAGPAHSCSATVLTVSFCDVAGAQACVLVFSTIDRESFEAISSWREKVVAEVGDIPTVLVQNKIDLLDDSCIKK